ncbi:unnamed protein product [Parnassius apollo]|uniref:(apollo) hypothetical protein n=1 Tax=Parnassius apollo TaxID=110799 RepID=A0A8S3XLT1_PARAO|nr:unnamed protein product [Parnassius apollo]
MLKVAYVFLCFILSGSLISGQENIGDPCEVEELFGSPGTCKLDYLCDYADKLINEEKKRPTYCYLDTKVSIVCCPNHLYVTGVLGRAFLDSQNGKITSNDIECRYNGNLPLICCKREPISNRSPITVVGRLSDTCRDKSTQAACNACYANAQPVEDSIFCPQNNALKIAGGEPAEIEEFPHMVILGCRNKKKIDPNEKDIAWVGAGSLISSSFVLTAAHVLHEPSYGKIEFALLGTTNKSDIRSGVLRYVVRTLQHKQYETGSHYNDIALVELDYEVGYSKFIRPACLPVPGVAPDDLPKSMIVAGWGRTGQNLNTSILLKKGEMNILETRECRKNVKARNFRWDSNTMLCARSPTADTCSGDSGGPLMVPLNMTSRLCGHFVTGIVSWGSVCGLNKVGSYTRVSNPDYLKWIISTVWPEPKRAQP